MVHIHSDVVDVNICLQKGGGVLGNYVIGVDGVLILTISLLSDI